MDEGPTTTFLSMARFLRLEHEVLHGNVMLCDQKAGFLLAFTSAMVIYCLQVLSTVLHAKTGGYPGLAIQIIYAIGALGFSIASFFSLRVVRPRFHTHSGDYIFWDSELFKLPESQFITALNALDGEKLSYAVQVHLYNLATICRRKYSAFGKAIRNAEFAFAIVAAGEITRALI